MRRLIMRLFVFNTLILVIASLGLGQQSAVKVSGLKGPVTGRRDARSIPYIEAQTEGDLYFMQGYTTASDRLWQMDLMRRLARGETAEIFGKAALEQDKYWRRYGFAGIASESVDYLSPELRSALESYTAGVNAYIASLDDSTLPVEFKILQYKPRSWTPADSLVIGKILADALSSTWRQDILKASLQSLPKEKLDDLTRINTSYDVLMFGKDEPVTKKATASNSNSTIDIFSAGFSNFSSYSDLVHLDLWLSSLFSTTEQDEKEPKKMNLKSRAFNAESRLNEQPISNDLLAVAEKQDVVRKESLETVGLYAEDLAASNNWVISGKRTADGKPLIANDPHLQATAPGIWYLSHLETPSMRVAGVTFPGVPGIVLGHNNDIAWGATNVGPDVQDVYVETFDDSGRVKTAKGWETARVRKEEIKVRLNPLKPDTETISMDVVETPNGVVILEENGKKYSLKWTARDPKNNDIGAFFLLNRARNWDEFNAALKTYRGASQNFVFADSKGNIGWHIAGAIPTRKTGDGSLPYDGSTADGEWTGMIPYEELPFLYNPPSGFIVTANQRIVGTNYKYPQLVRDFAPPWRARRLFDLLSAENKATMDFVTAAQRDSYNIPLVNLSNEILKANSGSPETLALLKAWNGRMTPDSKAALLVNEIRTCLTNKIVDENKGVPANAIRERILDWAVREHSARWLPSAFKDYPEFLKACETESVAGLPKKYGADPERWVWGAVAASRFPHPLAAAPLIGAQFATPSVGIEGSGQTPNVASSVSMRFVASPGNWDATRHVIPLGQSGDPRSPHFKDQFEAWRTGTPAVFPFSKDAISKSSVATTVYSP